MSRDKALNRVRYKNIKIEMKPTNQHYPNVSIAKTVSQN